MMAVACDTVGSERRAHRRAWRPHIDRRDILALARLQTLGAHLAGVGAELSDVPHDVLHEFVVEKFGDRWEPEAVALAQDLVVNDTAGLAHHEEVDCATRRDAFKVVIVF